MLKYFKYTSLKMIANPEKMIAGSNFVVVRGSLRKVSGVEANQWICFEITPYSQPPKQKGLQPPRHQLPVIGPYPAQCCVNPNTQLWSSVINER